MSCTPPVEGDAGLIASFLAADLVDEVVAYVTPVLLGAGPTVTGPFGAHILTGGRRFRLQHASTAGDDVLITATR